MYISKRWFKGMGMGLPLLLLVGAAPTREPVATKAKTTLTLWFPGSNVYPYNILTQKFEQSHPGITVHVDLVSNADSYIKYTAAIGSGTGPNLIMTYGYQPVLTWAADHLVLPLNQAIRTYHIKLPSYWSVVNEALVHGGQIYGVPVEVDEPMLLYNKTMFKKAGLNPNEPPKTIAQLTADARKLTIFKNGTLVQAGLVPADRWGLNVWVRFFGGAWYNPKVGRFDANQTANVAAFKWLASMYTMLGGVAKATAFESANKVGNAFLAGKEAMEIGGEWVPLEATPNRAILANTGPAAEGYSKISDIPLLNYGFAPVPVGPGLKPGSKTFISPGNTFVIPRDTKNLKATMELMAWLGSQYATNYYNEKTLDLPPFPSGAQVGSKFWKEAPAERPWLKELDTAGRGAGPVAAVPTYSYWSTTRSRYEQEIIRGTISPQQGLTQLNANANAYLQQFNATHPGW